jgi:hypothetical protein
VSQHRRLAKPEFASSSSSHPGKRVDRPRYSVRVLARWSFQSYRGVIDNEESERSSQWTSAPIYGGRKDAMSDRFFEKLMSQASELVLLRSCLKYCAGRRARMHRYAMGSRLCATNRAARTGLDAPETDETFQSDRALKGMQATVSRIPQAKSAQT